MKVSGPDGASAWQLLPISPRDGSRRRPGPVTRATGRRASRVQPWHSLGDSGVKTFDFPAFSPRRVLLYGLLAAIAALWSPVPTHGASVAYTNGACTGFTVSGTPPNQTVTCVTASGGSGGGVPACAPTASPSASVSTGQQVVISANCSNSPTAYIWSGSACSSAGATCTDAKSFKGSKTYSVSGTNGSGTGPSASITINWR